MKDTNCAREACTKTCRFDEIDHAFLQINFQLTTNRQLINRISMENYATMAVVSSLSRATTMILTECLVYSTLVQKEVADLKFPQCSLASLADIHGQYICNTGNVGVTTLDHMDIYT